MFSKLLKHEWKQTAPLLSILSGCALGAGLLGALILKVIFLMAKRQEEQDLSVIGMGGLSSALTFIIILLAAYAFAVQFIVLFRFYKNKFTDEGYLTFTLPVTARQIFLSSFLNAFAWLVISMLVLLVAAGMIIFIGASGPLKEYSFEIRYILANTFGIIEQQIAGEPGLRTFITLSNVSTLIKPVYSLMMLMTSITIGSVLARKHKIFATIGIYLGIGVAKGIVESALDILPVFFLFDSQLLDSYAYVNAVTVLYMLLEIGMMIGGYFLSVHLMKNKLNLP